MKPVIFSPDAILDLEDIWLYIAQDDIDRADRFVDKLRAFCEGELALFPEIGAPRDYLSKGVLAFPYRNYMLYYRISKGVVQIIRIMHGSVDKESGFSEIQRGR